MSAIIMKNMPAGDATLPVPTREDGGRYGWCMYFDNDAEVAFADGPEDLLEILSPGYLELDEDGQLIARIKLAQNAAAIVQADLLVDVDQDSLSEKEWAALLAPRQLAQPAVGSWTCEVPLVAVDMSYIPYTAVPRPTSPFDDGTQEGAPNLWWVSPAEEEELLITLHRTGFVRVMTAGA